MEYLRRNLEVSTNSTDDDRAWGECEAIFTVPRLATIIITALLIFVQILQNFTELVHLKIYLPKVHLFTYRQTAVFLSRDQDLDEFETSSGAVAFVESPNGSSSDTRPLEVTNSSTPATNSRQNHRVGILDTHLLLFVRVKEDINPLQHLRESKWVANMALYLDRLEWILQKPTYPLLPLMDWIQKEKLSAEVDVTSWNSSFLYGRSVGHLYCTLLICMMLFCPVAFYTQSSWIVAAMVLGFVLFLVQVKLFCSGHFKHFFLGIVIGFLAALSWTPTGLLRNCFLSLLTVLYCCFLNVILDFYIVVSWILFFFDYCFTACSLCCRDDNDNGESRCCGCLMFFLGFYIFYFGSALIAYGVLYAQLLSISVFLIMNIIPFVSEFYSSNGQIGGVFTPL